MNPNKAFKEQTVVSLKDMIPDDLEDLRISYSNGEICLVDDDGKLVASFPSIEVLADAIYEKFKEYPGIIDKIVNGGTIG